MWFTFNLLFLFHKIRKLYEKFYSKSITIKYLDCNRYFLKIQKKSWLRNHNIFHKKRVGFYSYPFYLYLLLFFNFHLSNLSHLLLSLLTLRLRHHQQHLKQLQARLLLLLLQLIAEVLLLGSPSLI